MKHLISLFSLLLATATASQAAYDDPQATAPASVLHPAALATGSTYDHATLLNGRIYDPQLGRFLSTDPVVQDPYNLQCYNRYSYCMNSPLGYTDPTGYDTEPTWLKGQRTDMLVEAYGPVKGSEIAQDANDKEAIGGIVGGIAVPVIYIVIPRLLGPLTEANGATTSAAGNQSPANERVDEGSPNTESDEGKIDHVDKPKPSFEGKPGSTQIGENQSRTYGDDGYPETDRDHPHGGGPAMEQEDHVHDWDRPENGDKPTNENRQPARPPQPNDPPKPRGPGVSPPPPPPVPPKSITDIDDTIY